MPRAGHLVVSIVPATASHNFSEIHNCIEDGYRGKSGWTGERALIAGNRITASALSALIANSNAAAPTECTVFVALASDRMIRGALAASAAGNDADVAGAAAASGDDDALHVVGTVQVEWTASCRVACVGLLSVRGDVQSCGVGRQLFRHAEAFATSALLDARTLEVWAIEIRSDLVPWYKSMGYADTGRRVPFPPPEAGCGVPRQPLHFAVLAKSVPLLMDQAKHERMLRQMMTTDTLMLLPAAVDKAVKECTDHATAVLSLPPLDAFGWSRGPSLVDCERARERIAADCVRTELRAVTLRDGGAAAPAPAAAAVATAAHSAPRQWLKIESTQRGGSFKTRGVCNAVRCRVEAVASRRDAQGVAVNELSTISAGNTAKSLAIAVDTLVREGDAGRWRCRSMMTPTASATKRSAFEALGGQVLARSGAEMMHAMALQADALTAPRASDSASPRDGRADFAGTSFVHPWLDPDVQAGHATLALEVAEQWASALAADEAASPGATRGRFVRKIYIPIGGGGLAAGAGSVFHHCFPNAELIGVESSACAPVARELRRWNASFSRDAFDECGADGAPASAMVPSQLCDGISVPIVEPRLFPLLSHVLSRVVTVTDEQVRDAIRWLHIEHCVAAEGSGAAAVAAMRAEAQCARESGCCGDPADGGDVLCVISGGNIDLSLFNEITA